MRRKLVTGFVSGASRSMAMAIAMTMAAVLGACGSSNQNDPDAGADAPVDDTLDLGRAHWVHAPVYSDSSTSVSSIDLAIRPDGELIAAWAEDLGDTLIETSIFVGNGGPDFESGSVMAIGGQSFTRPSLGVGASDVHLVAQSNGGATNSDIFYARRSGGTWGPQVNLTGQNDPNAFTDHDPEVLESGGEIIVLYRSSIASMSIENNGIYMRRFTNEQAVGPEIAVLDRANFDCNDFEAVVDSGGSIHLVANCRQDAGDRTVRYMTNKSGMFVSQTITAANATSPLSPDIAISSDGNTVHLLWNASTDCGGLTCRDVFYSRDLAPPVSVTGGEEDGGFIPHVAVDSLGRVIVAFHRLGNVDDIMWSYSESGNAFVRVQLATAGTPGSIDLSVGNLVINPITDRPHMVYIHSLPGVGGSNATHGELVR